MSKSNHRDQTLLLIDSHALIHRAYHAFPPSLTNAKGQLTNATYGFASLLLDVLIKFKPSHVVALFDSPGGTVRHDMYPAYKANRSSPDDDLIVQIPMVEQLLEAFDIPTLKLVGYEADDLIGTIDERHSGEWARTIIVTGDRDLFQLVDEDTFVYLAGSSFSKSKLYDIEGVKEKMGVGPDYIVDIKSLEGDASDNIPGVAGIGKKGAVTLVDEFGHLNEIYDRISDIPNRYQKKLSENYEMAVKSKHLATIITDAPIDFDFDQAPFGTYDMQDIQNFFQEMEFYSLRNKLDKLPTNAPDIQRPKTETGEQQTLFTPVQKLPTWDGKPVKADEVFLKLDTDQQGDPLQWECKKLVVDLDGEATIVEQDRVKDFFEKSEFSWLVTADAKQLLHCLYNLGVSIDFSIYDVIVSTYLAAYGQIKQDLDSVVNWYKLGFNEDETAQILKLREIYTIQRQGIEEDDQLKNLMAVEQKLISVVVGMERNGIMLDVGDLNEGHDVLSDAVDQIKQQVFDEVGHEFNIGSPKQVGEVLFEERGLPAGRKTKSGSYSTDERTLRELVDVDPIVGNILRYRELTKLLSTYVKPLPQQVNPVTKRVHGTFNQLGALTGRFSSVNPNMQNIPIGEVEGVNIRNAFKSPEGSVFVAFDYSQQELRLLAELSGEETMQEAFATGEDIHARTAAEIFDLDIDKVTKDQRRVGKTVNFGIIYGMSAFGFADRLKVSQAEALQFIEKYFNRYDKVQAYFDSLIEQAKDEGFVETIMGRKRSTAGLRSPNFQMRKATEREVMNFPLQGSAADIIKMAMNNVADVMDQYPAKLVLQVHDELIFEYETSSNIADLTKDMSFVNFANDVQSKMLEVIKLKVPLEVGLDVGNKWGGLSPLDI